MSGDQRLFRRHVPLDLAQMILAASPPSIQIASQPEVTSLTGAPLVARCRLLAIHVFVRLGLPQVAGGRVERSNPISLSLSPALPHRPLWSRRR